MSTLRILHFNVRGFSCNVHAPKPIAPSSASPPPPPPIQRAGGRGVQNVPNLTPSTPTPAPVQDIYNIGENATGACATSVFCGTTCACSARTRRRLTPWRVCNWRLLAEPVGGAARFAGKLKELREASPTKPMITFGGDALSPSQST
jgi:hypothetical protein